MRCVCITNLVFAWKKNMMYLVGSRSIYYSRKYRFTMWPAKPASPYTSAFILQTSAIMKSNFLHEVSDRRTTTQTLTTIRWDTLYSIFYVTSTFIRHILESHLRLEPLVINLDGSIVTLFLVLAWSLCSYNISA